MAKQFAAILVLTTLALVGCNKQPSPASATASPQVAPQNSSTMKLSSSAFKEGEAIPRGYTCDGANVSPPLEWSDVPKNAKTLSLIADDPDAPAGTWVHWVFYNLPAENIGLVENVPLTDNLKAGGFQGKNDFQKTGYGGPCPPSSTHRYFFKLYAIDSDLPLKAGATRADLEKAMNGHVVGQAQLMGTYRR